MAHSPLSAPKLTDFPLTEERIAFAIQAHYDRIGKNIDDFRSGNITLEALREVRETGDTIRDFAEMAMCMRGRVAA